MSIVGDIIINTMDYFIMHKYFNNFSEKRNLKKKYCIGLFCMCVLMISIVNQYQNQEINLFACIAMIYLYNLSFSYGTSYHWILPILYIGFGIVAEIVGYLFLNLLDNMFPYTVQYYVSAIVCELVRLLIVYFVCGIKKVKEIKLPIGVSKIAVTLSILSILICCIVINIMQNTNDNLISLLSALIIIMIVIGNVYMFKMFFKVIETLSDNHEKEMLLQESRAKEQYYREIQQSNENVRKIKHDLKNMLIAVCGKAKGENEISEEINNILKELDAGDKKIYTSNVVINTIINHKVCQGENKNIRIQVNIRVSKNIKLDYKDAGILLGNILDNAIEACEKIQIERRWIKIDMLQKGRTILIKVSNSKSIEPTDIEKSSKKDESNHGIGTKSIKSIVNKYKGKVEFNDKGSEFEVVASVYETE